MDKYFRSGRASGDSANELIINIKAIRIVNWGCAVKALRKHRCITCNISPSYSSAFALSVPHSFIHQFSLILHCIFSLYLLPWSWCSSFALSFFQSFFPCHPLAALMTISAKVKCQSNLGVSAFARAACALRATVLIRLKVPVDWKTWACIINISTQLETRAAYWESQPCPHQHAAPAFYRPLNRTRPSARIHQIIFHHCAMSDGLKMLPALLEELPGELRWEGWILYRLDVMWMGGGLIILFAWEGTMERRRVYDVARE